MFPDYSKSAIAMSCTGRTSPLSVGLRHIQRTAILSDPSFHGGDYAEHGAFPHRGLSTARQLAMLVYKSWDTFSTRFSWDAKPPFDSSHNSFEIESYLTHHVRDQFCFFSLSFSFFFLLFRQGNKFSRDKETAYDPNCYLLLSKASDLTSLQFRGRNVPPNVEARVEESYLEAVLRIKCRLLLFGITSDIVIPISEQTEIYNILRSASSCATTCGHPALAE